MASAGIVTVTGYGDVRPLKHAVEDAAAHVAVHTSDLRAHQQWWSSLKPHQRLARRIRGMCRT